MGQHDGRVSASLRSLLGTAVVTASVLAVSACNPLEQATTTSGCEAAVDAAADAVEIDDQVRFLDEALLQCRSVSALTTELNRHPGLIGYSAERFVSVRCARIDDPATLRAPACASVVTPTTLAPTTTLAEIVYVGETLDGRPIELRPGPEIEFVGDVPAVVQQTVDIALESGCDGLLEQRNLWFERITPTPDGDVASVYARHAQNVADYIQCDLPPLPES